MYNIAQRFLLFQKQSQCSNDGACGLDSCAHSSDTCSTDNEDEYLDELFLLEVERRRERDFGRSDSVASSGSQSWAEKERIDDFECDSLCTESDCNEEVKSLQDSDSKVSSIVLRTDKEEVTVLQEIETGIISNASDFSYSVM